MSWILLCILVTIPSFLLVYLWWVRRRAKLLIGDLPGWPGLPILGNALKFYGDTRLLFQRLEEITLRSEETNKIFKIWFGAKLCLIISKPEDIKVVTNNFVEKPYYYSFGRDWLGDGLVTASATVWKHNIKKLAGTFSGSIVDEFQDVFNEQAKKLVGKMSQEVGGQPFDALQKYLAYTTLETICQTAFGIPDISQSIVTSEYYQAFNRTLELMVSRGLNLVKHPDCIYRLTPAYREFKKCIKVLHNVSETVIRQKRNEPKLIKDNAATPKKRFRAFLDVLMELSTTDPTFTDVQIRAEVDTIIVGGQETTASSLAFALLMLGCNPRVQDKLYDEFQEIFGDSAKAPDKDDLLRMKYCEAVIYETLRLYPPLPVVLRSADSELKLEDCTIPANAACAVNSWGAGRSKRLWGADVLVFRPERWLEGAPPHPAAFLPFSYGRRSCIGKKYAINLLKTVLSYCVRNLKFNSQDKTLKLKLDVVLRPIEGHLVTVENR